MSYFKYPRTFHLPWSEGFTDDDKRIQSLDTFRGKRVIVTEKMDGENTSMYRDYIHARSIDSQNHPSRNWVKQFWSKFSNQIPQGWRICGENLYAKHSIHYLDLPSYFMAFSIWNNDNICLDWDSTLEWFELLELIHPPVIYDGSFSESLIKSLWNEKNSVLTEGYVVRLAEPIRYEDFSMKFAKFVRKGHVQTSKHWMHRMPIVPNKLT